MSLSAAIAAWLSGCPALSGKTPEADFLGASAGSCSLEILPGPVITRQFLDGSSLRQTEFRVSLRLPWGGDSETQQRNAAQIEEVCSWIIQQHSARNFPVIENADVLSVTVTSCGSLFEQSRTWAGYQVTAEIEYMAEAV